MAGDVTSFYLGRQLGRDFLVQHGPRVTITEERLEKVEAFFERHGGKAILIGRFVGLVRAIAPFLAGSSGMTLRRFLPYDVIGAGLWGSTFVLLGYIFWQSFDRVVHYAKKGALALGTVIVSRGRDRGSCAGSATTTTAGAIGFFSRQAERPVLRPVARVVVPIVLLARAARRFSGTASRRASWGSSSRRCWRWRAVGSFVFVGDRLGGEQRGLRAATATGCEWPTGSQPTWPSTSRRW